MSPCGIDECASNGVLVGLELFVEPTVEGGLIGLRCGRCRKTRFQRHDGHLSDSQDGHNAPNMHYSVVKTLGRQPICFRVRLVWQFAHRTSHFAISRSMDAMVLYPQTRRALGPTRST